MPQRGGPFVLDRQPLVRDAHEPEARAIESTTRRPKRLVPPTSPLAHRSRLNVSVLRATGTLAVACLAGLALDAPGSTRAAVRAPRFVPADRDSERARRGQRTHRPHRPARISPRPRAHPPPASRSRHVPSCRADDPRKHVRRGALASRPARRRLAGERGRRNGLLSRPCATYCAVASSGHGADRDGGHGNDRGSLTGLRLDRRHVHWSSPDVHGNAALRTRPARGRHRPSQHARRVHARLQLTPSFRHARSA